MALKAEEGHELHPKAPNPGQWGLGRVCWMGQGRASLSVLHSSVAPSWSSRMSPGSSKTWTVVWVRSGGSSVSFHCLLGVAWLPLLCGRPHHAARAALAWRGRLSRALSLFLQAMSPVSSVCGQGGRLHRDPQKLFWRASLLARIVHLLLGLSRPGPANAS